MQVVDVDVRQAVQVENSPCSVKDYSPLNSPEVDFGTSGERVAGIQGRIKLKHSPSFTPVPELLDKERKQLQIYEYLCHIGEAKEWVETCIGRKIGDVIDMEEKMRDGVWLAELANAIDTDSPPKKIFSSSTKLHYRHSDNINIFLDYMRKLKFPEIFYFELTDLYDKKNFPKVIYCIHALGCFLSRKGVTSPIKDLVGRLEFTQEEINAVDRSLDNSGIILPCFRDVTLQVSKVTIPESEISEVMESTQNGLVLNEQDQNTDLLTDKSENQDKIKEYNKPVSPESMDQGITELIEDTNLKRSETVDIERSVDENEHLEDKDHADLETEYMDVISTADSQAALERAALVTQRIFRGNIAMEEVQHILKLKGVVHTLENVFLFKKKIYEALLGVYVDRMATIIQSAYRAHLARIKVRKLREELGMEPLNTTEEEILKRLRNSAIPNISDLCYLLNTLGYTGENYIIERECEYRRRELVRAINENYVAQKEVNEADKTISLLIQNMQDYANHASKSKKNKSKDSKNLLKPSLRSSIDHGHGVSKSTLSNSTKHLNGGAHSNKSSILHSGSSSSAFTKSYYGELFLLLRTRPKHLANFLLLCNREESPSVFRCMENFVKTLLSECASQKEEYLFMSLILELAKLEISEYPKVETLFKSNPIFVNFFMMFTKLGKNAEYFKNLLGEFVRIVIDDDTLDLDLDPVSIYDKLSRKKASSSEDKRVEEHTVALKTLTNDPEIIGIVSDHVKRLISTSTMFLSAMTGSADAMPINIKYVLTQLRLYMQKFFASDPGDIMKFISVLIYYKCFSPMITMPDKYGIVDRQISHTASSNLAEISRTLNQISTCRLLLLPNSIDCDILNNYITESHKTFRQFVDNITEVYSLPGYNEFDLVLDNLSSDDRPCLNLKESDIYIVHKLLLEHIKDVTAGNSSDILNKVLKKLPPPPPQYEKNPNDSTIKLVLESTFPIEDEDLVFYLRLLLVKAKELVITVLRVQTGDNVFDILEQHIDSHHEEVFQKLLRDRQQLILYNSRSCNPNDIVVEPVTSPKQTCDEQSTKVMPNLETGLSPSNIDTSTTLPHTGKDAFMFNSTPSSANFTHQTSNEHITGCIHSTPDTPLSATDSASYIDLVLERNCSDITFSKFKRVTLEVMSKLEKGGEVFKSNKYCDITSRIAKFIINQKYNPMHMKNTLAILNQKLQRLSEKNKYLYDKKRSYNDYVNSIYMTMTSHKRFSFKHSSHLPSANSPDTGKLTSSSHPDLTKQTQSTPTSYVCDCLRLYKKGIIVSIGDLTVKDYGQVQLAITLKQNLQLSIHSTYFMVGMPEEITLDFRDLLIAQDTGIETMKQAQDITFNVPKLIRLLNKKFFS